MRGSSMQPNALQLTLTLGIPLPLLSVVAPVIYSSFPSDLCARRQACGRKASLFLQAAALLFVPACPPDKVCFPFVTLVASEKIDVLTSSASLLRVNERREASLLRIPTPTLIVVPFLCPSNFFCEGTGSTQTPPRLRCHHRPCFIFPVRRNDTGKAIHCGGMYPI